MKTFTDSNNFDQPLLWKGAHFSHSVENGYLTFFLTWPLRSAFHAAAYNAVHLFAEQNGYSLKYNDGFEMVDYKWEATGNFVDRFDEQYCFIHLVLPREDHRRELFQMFNVIKSEVAFGLSQEQFPVFAERCLEFGITASAHPLGKDMIATAVVTVDQCNMLSKDCLASTDGWNESASNEHAETDWLMLLELANGKRSVIKAKRLHEPNVFAVG